MDYNLKTTQQARQAEKLVTARGKQVRSDYLMSGYLAASPDTSRVSMLGSLSRMKSVRMGSRAKGFTSGTDPSPSYTGTHSYTP